MAIIFLALIALIAIVTLSRAVKAWRESDTRAEEEREEREQQEAEYEQDVLDGKWYHEVRGDYLFAVTPDSEQALCLVGDILVLAEVTTDHGPFAGDHFLGLVIYGDDRICLIPAVHMPLDTLDTLLNMLGAERTESIGENTSFDSRIMYPPELRDERLYDLNAYLRTEMYVYTDRVREYIELVESGESEAGSEL